MKRISPFLVFLLFLTPLTIKSQYWESLVITDQNFGYLSVEKNLIQLFEDPSKDLVLEEVLKGDVCCTFNTLTTRIPNLGFSQSAIWLRFKIDNQTSSEMTKILEIKNPNLDVVTLYAISSGNPELLGVTGDYFNFQKRNVDHRYYQFPITLEANSEVTYYLRVDNNGEQLHIPIRLWDNDSLVKRDYKEQSLFGIYYGILLFVFFLNLFIYILIRERANLYYLLYIIGLGFLQMALSGYAFELLWPNNTFLANHSLPFLASSSVLFLLLFSRSFLNTKELLPRSDFFLKIATFVVIANVITSLINNALALKVSIVLINAVTLILNLFIIPIAIQSIRKGFKPAVFFVSAFVVLVIGVFSFVLKNFGVLPSNFYTDYGIQVGSALEVILLSFAIVDKFKRFKDEAVNRLQEMNELKDEINVRLEEQVAERTKEINFQNKELAEKNKNITDSIQYASRIQMAILPPEDYIKSLLPDSFIYYRPKDIVSGDFYWIEEKGGKIFVAVVDCTGHGVPGAMMSVIGFNGLNKAVNIEGLLKPSDILSSLNKTVSSSLRKSSEFEVSDGMDLAICAIDTKNNTLEYAGAYNPIYLVKKNAATGNSEIEEIKADKKPIGSYVGDDSYVNHEIPISDIKGFYIFSDGYADQFGGKNGKKFKYKPFRELLLSNFNQPLDEQLKLLNKSFDQWKGEIDQIDDVCVIGLKFNS